VTKDGEPWFVAMDVCAALELDNVGEALKRVDWDDRANISLNDFISPSHQIRKFGIINEYGLYSLHQYAGTSYRTEPQRTGIRYNRRKTSLDFSGHVQLG